MPLSIPEHMLGNMHPFYIGPYAQPPAQAASTKPELGIMMKPFYI
jgi:hypothetical protein